MTLLREITVTQSALPTGAATSAKQDTGNSSLATIASQTNGVSTAAKQDTGNASLATIASSEIAMNASATKTQPTLVTRPVDYNMLVARGFYQDQTANVKDALKNDVDTGTTLTDDISNELAAGAAYTGFPASPVASEIVVAGADTGTVYYSYMAADTDTDYTFGSKAVTGAGTYSLGHNIWRCNFAYFVNSSTTSFNAGNITVESVAGPGTNIYL